MGSLPSCQDVRAWEEGRAGVGRLAVPQSFAQATSIPQPPSSSAARTSVQEEGGSQGAAMLTWVIREVVRATHRSSLPIVNPATNSPAGSGYVASLLLGGHRGPPSICGRTSILRTLRVLDTPAQLNTGRNLNSSDVFSPFWTPSIRQSIMPETGFE